MAYKTEQEEFWAGEFGDQYISRNKDQKVFASKIAMFSKIISERKSIHSSLEFGANIGLNLRAIGMLLPECSMGAIEINAKAARICSEINNVEVYNQSILDFTMDKKWDLTFTMGVLIHIAPEELEMAYEKLYEYSRRYVLVGEYYNPTPVEVGVYNKLCK